MYEVTRASLMQVLAEGVVSCIPEVVRPKGEGAWVCVSSCCNQNFIFWTWQRMDVFIYKTPT